MIMPTAQCSNVQVMTGLGLVGAKITESIAERSFHTGVGPPLEEITIGVTVQRSQHVDALTQLCAIVAGASQRSQEATTSSAKKPAFVREDGVRHHMLKTWPFPFEDVKAGHRPFEYRRFDRDFRVGDVLVLEKWEPDKERYLGAIERRRVTHLLPGGTFGVPEGYCVMGLGPEERTMETTTDDHDVDEWVLGASSAGDSRIFLNGEVVGDLQADAAESFFALLYKRGPCSLAGCERMAEHCYVHSAVVDSSTEAATDTIEWCAEHRPKGRGVQSCPSCAVSAYERALGEIDFAVDEADGVDTKDSNYASGFECFYSPDAVVERVKHALKRSDYSLRIIAICPICQLQHIDEGEWATRPHRRHRCVDGPFGKGCGYEWTIAAIPTVGVRSEDLRITNRLVATCTYRVGIYKCILRDGHPRFEGTVTGHNLREEIARSTEAPAERFEGLRFEYIGTEDYLVVCGFCGCRTSGFGLACCSRGIEAQKHLRGHAQRSDQATKEGK